MIIDSHCHLDFSKFRDAGFKNYDEQYHDMQAILKRAKDNEITHILAIGTTLQDSVENISVSRGTLLNESPQIFAAVGIHPDYAESTLVDYSSQNAKKLLSDMTKESEVVCIGECGLDYRNGEDHKKEQLLIFEMQCELSAETNLPLEIHSRYAENDTIGVLKNGNYNGVIHCFSSSLEFAKQALDLGFLISFSGIVTFKNAKEIQKVAKYVPDDMFLIETDSPFLAPTPFRGKVNEPAFVKQTGEFLANLRETTVENVYRNTAQNFFKLFDKAIAR